MPLRPRLEMDGLGLGAVGRGQLAREARWTRESDGRGTSLRAVVERSRELGFELEAREGEKEEVSFERASNNRSVVET